MRFCGSYTIAPAIARPKPLEPAIGIGTVFAVSVASESPCPSEQGRQGATRANAATQLWAVDSYNSLGAPWMWMKTSGGISMAFLIPQIIVVIVLALILLIAALVLCYRP